jgi:hypothetical protein
MVFHGVAAVAGVTVVNTSILAAREEMPPVVRPFLLKNLFAHGLWMKLPTRHEMKEIRNPSRLRRHTRALQYFRPMDCAGWMPNIMKTIEGLGIALFTGFYHPRDQ